jgi:putative transposase
MSGKFKQYTPEFKAKVIKEMLKSEQTQAEIASKYGISVKTLQLWYGQFQDGIETIFAQGKQEKSHKEALKEKEKQLNEAYREIGSLTTQINWVKKKCDQFGINIPKRDD